MVPSPEVNAHTREEWRELGFYYDYEKENSCWRFIGSKAGLLRFSDLITKYTSNPRNYQISEHDHYGPYMYLKLCTWEEPIISEDGIFGRTEDLTKLANFIQERVEQSIVGQCFTIKDEFSNDSKSAMLFEVREQGFDPSSVDPCLQNS